MLNGCGGAETPKHIKQRNISQSGGPHVIMSKASILGRQNKKKSYNRCYVVVLYVLYISTDVEVFPEKARLYETSYFQLPLII